MWARAQHSHVGAEVVGCGCGHTLTLMPKMVGCGCRHTLTLAPKVVGGCGGGDGSHPLSILAVCGRGAGCGCGWVDVAVVSITQRCLYRNVAVVVHPHLVSQEKDVAVRAHLAQHLIHNYVSQNAPRMIRVDKARKVVDRTEPPPRPFSEG